MNNKFYKNITIILIAIITIMVVILIKAIDAESKNKSRLYMDFQCENNGFEYYIVTDDEYDKEYIAIQYHDEKRGAYEGNQSSCVAITPVITDEDDKGDEDK